MRIYSETLKVSYPSLSIRQFSKPHIREYFTINVFMIRSG